jgi:hypothetical protein
MDRDLFSDIEPDPDPGPTLAAAGPAPRCPCGGTETKLSWQTARNGAHHLRASYGRCGRFLRWVRQTKADREAAP